MDTRPIGVFDSGLGGLTAVRELRQLLPSENIIYFGDTARVPYGGRSAEILLKYARQDVRFLRSHDIKAILVACGTVSTTALPQLRQESDIPILGVVEPACRRAAAVTRNRRVGLIATAASVRSGAYQRSLRQLDPDIAVTAKACPLFVPLVENGRFRRGDVVIETVAREYLEPLRREGLDTLILGCTHYPLLTDIIGDIMGPGGAGRPGHPLRQRPARAFRVPGVLFLRGEPHPPGAAGGHRPVLTHGGTCTDRRHQPQPV